MSTVSQPKPSNLKAAVWMSGWLAAMLLMLVAGRESANTINAFQVMVIRSVIGFFLLLPLIYTAGGFAATFTVEATDASLETASRVLKVNVKIPGCYNCHSAENF